MSPDQARPSVDWMLEDLVRGVPGTRDVVVLSADGLRIGHSNTDTEAADRLAAACSGLQSLAAAISEMHPGAERGVNLVVIEAAGGFFYLMAAGAGAYLAVLADETVDPGLMGQQMRDLVARLGDHLSSAPRDDHRAPA
jgi:predicted regulator of Ras-like GTPase activity (Roadblock/LC7/MglB family)